eukprot:349641-Chlamydomonas_euryale.AAC.21
MDDSILCFATHNIAGGPVWAATAPGTCRRGRLGANPEDPGCDPGTVWAAHSTQSGAFNAHKTQRAA